MKKVLIIVYYWRERMPGLAKHLPEFGWQPIILTTPAPLDDPLPSELTIIETPYSDALRFWKRLFRLNLREQDVRSQVKSRLGISSKKSVIDPLLTLLGEITSYPDIQRGWKTFAIQSASKFLQTENIDVMISTSLPVTCHIITKELKKKYMIPWVADLRDLWSQNHNYGYGSIRRRIDRRLELKTLFPADALVTVSPVWAEELRTLHKREVVYSITNGFDPAEMNTGGSELTPKFTITYTGVIYTGKQEPSRLFSALKDLISEGDINPADVEVRFYGSEHEWLTKEIEGFGLSDIVKQYGWVPRKVAFEKLRESQLLLSLNWNNQQGRGWYALKMFNYLAAQRPVLAVGGLGNDLAKELLEKTKAGQYGIAVEDIKGILRKLYSEYKLTGRINYHGDIKEINKYSHREMARKYAEVLDHVTGGD
jgi:hypothetical protein